MEDSPMGFWSRMFVATIVVQLAANSLAAAAPAAPPATTPATVGLPSVRQSFVLEGGRTLLILGGEGAGSFWATVDASTGKVIRKQSVADAELRGASITRTIALIWGRYPQRTQNRYSPAPYLAAWDLATGKELAKLGESEDMDISAAV